MSFFKTLVAATPADPPISFISTCCEVPFRTVITVPPGSSPNRTVDKQRENTANTKTFIVLIAFVPIYLLNDRSQSERPTDLIALQSMSLPDRFRSVDDSSCS